MDKEYVNKKLNMFYKRTVQFVLSISVFSFFLWYSSGFCILPQFFNAYFSTCLFSMLTRTLERKYMFLICNTILALLTISPNFYIQFQASTQVSQEADLPLGAFRFIENASLMQLQEPKRQEQYSQHVSEAEDTLLIQTEGRVSEATVAAEEEEEDDELVAEDTTMELETNIEEPPNTEELNRKFEEFIRKMKEEMRIEAQRREIAV